MVEHEPAHAERRHVRQHRRRDQQHGSHDGAQQEQQHAEHDDEDHGHDHRPVALRRRRLVEGLRVLTPDQGVGVDLLHGGAEPLDRAEGGVAARRVGQHDAHRRHGRTRATDVGGLHVRDVRGCTRDLLGEPRARDDGGRGGGARRERRRERLLGGDRLRRVEELLVLTQPGAQAERPEGHEREHHQAAHGHERGAAGDAPTDAAPQAALGGVGVADARHERPEEPPSGDRHGRREHHEGEQDGDDDPGCPGEPDPVDEGGVGEQQGEEPEHDGAGAGEDGRACGTDGLAHRLATVLVAAQLLAVAGDEQQRVVGACSEHEDGRDAGGGAVDRQLGPVGDRLHDLRGHAVTEPDDGEGDEPEQRAAVGDDEQQGHDGGGDEQEPDVGALEDGTEVGLDCRRAGHLGVDPVGQAAIDGGPQRLDPVRVLLGADVAPQRDREQGDGSVGRRDRAGDGGPEGPGEGRPQPVEGRQVGARQAVTTTRDDDDRGCVVTSGDGGETRLGLGRVGRVRQVHGGVGALLRPGGENEHGCCEQQAEQQHGHGPPAPDEPSQDKGSMIETFHDRRIWWSA